MRGFDNDPPERIGTLLWGVWAVVVVLAALALLLATM